VFRIVRPACLSKRREFCVRHSVCHFFGLLEGVNGSDAFVLGYTTSVGYSVDRFDCNDAKGPQDDSA